MGTLAVIRRPTSLFKHSFPRTDAVARSQGAHMPHLDSAHMFAYIAHYYNNQHKTYVYGKGHIAVERLHVLQKLY